MPDSIKKPKYATAIAYIGLPLAGLLLGFVLGRVLTAAGLMDPYPDGPRQAARYYLDQAMDAATAIQPDDLRDEDIRITLEAIETALAHTEKRRLTDIMKLSKSRYVAFTALGIALYVALGFAVQVPVFENYYIYLGYVVMLLYAYVFGTGPTCAVGGIGCILYCLLTSGLRGMPGWTLGNIVMAAVIGRTLKKTALMTDRRMKLLGETATVALACIVGILLVKSYTEVLLYAQPMAVRMAKNIFAFVADLVVLEVSIPVCHALAPACKRIAYRTGTPMKKGDTT